MTEPGAPRHGRHSSADDVTGGSPLVRSGWEPDPGDRVARRYDVGAGRAAPGGHRSGLLDADATGPLIGGPLDLAPRAGGVGPYAARARHASDDPHDGDLSEPGSRHEPVEWPAGGYVAEGRHPSAPIPPRPAGVWDKLHRRDDADLGDDAPTEAARPVDGPPLPVAGRPGAAEQTDEPPTDAHAPVEWQDATGGLEVIGEHVDARPRRGRRGRRAERAAADVHEYDVHEHEAHPDEAYPEEHATEDELELHASDRRGGRSRRRPLVTALLLLLVAGVVAGVVFGGKTLLGVLNPTAEDYTGTGTGAVEIKVAEGDTLSDIATTLVGAGVIASTEPFVEAAEANAAATGIQPGTYTLRDEMSGQAALDLLLDPASRMLSRVTVPEGLTVAATLQRVADETGTPIEQLEAAAAQPAALGVPAYAGDQLEGYLFPATYDFEPGTEPADMLRQMVAQFDTVATEIGLEERAAAIGLTPAEVVTVASMVESETRLDEERADVAQVIYNRLEQDIPLGIDATLAYGLGKNGNELTMDDLESDSPYNTREVLGLPPTPISAPGRASLEAALAPTKGELLYYVLESEDGSHFFTDDYAEFQEARARCAAAGLGCGG